MTNIDRNVGVVFEKLEAWYANKSFQVHEQEQ